MYTPILKPSLLLVSLLMVLPNGQASNLQNGGHPMYNLTEGEYLALEGGSMLPYPETVAKIERELAIIRAKFPAVSEIKHNRKWIPGQVLTTKIDQNQITKLNSSDIGPLKHIERINVMPFFSVAVISFNKPYSPPVLAKKLEAETSAQFAPNTVYYEYEVDNITYRGANSTYIFKKGTGICKDNCPDRYLWEFQVDQSGNPTLLRNWTVPQNGERVIIY